MTTLHYRLLATQFARTCGMVPMTSTEICERKAEEARTRADQSVLPGEREIWLTVASEWTKLAYQPINGLIGKRTYAVRARQLP